MGRWQLMQAILLFAGAPLYLLFMLAAAVAAATDHASPFPGSAAMALAVGWAGALYAPFAGFANTELLFWLLSGQVLIMVIVGGAGTLIGPVLGAAFFMLMEHQLSAWTEAWALYFGLIFIAFVLFAPQGIWGLATTGLRRARPE